VGVRSYGGGAGASYDCDPDMKLIPKDVVLVYDDTTPTDSIPSVTYFINRNDTSYNTFNPLFYGLGGVSIQGSNTPVDGTPGVVRIEYTLAASVCFPAKTPITTDQGVFNIENINPDIHTIDNKKIIAISRTISPEKHLVCIEQNALGQNCPSKRTIMSLMHGVYINNKLVRAKDLVKRKGIYRIPYNKEILYNVVMEQHNKMGVNNMICETMNPNTSISKIYMKQYKDNLVKTSKAKKSIVNNTNINR